MGETVSISIDLEFAAILFNAVLLLAMGLAMLFAERIDRFGRQLVENGGGWVFFPHPRLDPAR